MSQREKKRKARGVGKVTQAKRAMGDLIIWMEQEYERDQHDRCLVALFALRDRLRDPETGKTPIPVAEVVNVMHREFRTPYDKNSVKAYLNAAMARLERRGSLRLSHAWEAMKDEDETQTTEGE